MQPDPDEPTYFYIHPAGTSSLPGSPVYADGSDPGNLTPLVQASGAEALPVAMVNAPSQTAVETAPRRTEIARAAPNPFNPSTVLSVEIGREGRARLDIHDLRGRRVRTLTDRVLDGGRPMLTEHPTVDAALAALS